MWETAGFTWSGTEPSGSSRRTIHLSATREEAENHPGRNIITRAVGSSPELVVDIISQQVEDGDIYILCTDGLTNMVSESEITGVVSGCEPEQACAKLIEAANERGGEDNITVIVIKC
jgi:protein phosphatase